MTTFKEVLNYKMTKKELVEYLEKNYTDEDNFVELEDLEFTKSDVNFSGMKVEGNLYQDSQKVGGNLDQSCQKVEGNLYQDCQKVEGNLYQDCQKVEGNLLQHSQKVGGNLDQSCQTFKGKIIKIKCKADELGLR